MKVAIVGASGAVGQEFLRGVKLARGWSGRRRRLRKKKRLGDFFL